MSAAQRPSGRLLPQPVAAKDDISHLRLFRHLQGIVNLDSEVPYRRLDAAVAEEELDSAQVFRAAVDQSRLRPPHRVRAVAHWIQPNVLDPPVDDSGVLAGADVGRFVQAARTQEIVRLKPCPVDPGFNGIARWRRDLELDRPLGLALQDASPRRNMIPVPNVANLQRGQIAGTELAVDTEVEESKLPNAFVHLQANSDRPDFLRLEGSLLSYKFSLVPGLAMLDCAVRFHHDHLRMEEAAEGAPPAVAGRGGLPRGRFQGMARASLQGQLLSKSR